MIDNELVLEIETYANRVRRTSRLLQKAQSGQLSSRAVQTYLWNIRYVLRHTCPNLQLARSVAMERGYADLAMFYEQKLVEEAGHDRWAEEDLLSLDPTLDFTREVEPLAPLSELMTFLRATVRREPKHYLTYVLFAEYSTVLLGPVWVSALEANCGIPASSMTAVGRHAELDKHHVQDELRSLRTLLGPDADYEDLLGTMRQFMHYWERFYDQLAELPN
jgi:hypothetical protein